MAIKKLLEEERELLPQQIAEALANVGVTSDIKGQRYLQTAVFNHYYDKKASIDYAGIAKQFETTSDIVEKDMKEAVEKIFQEHDIFAQHGVHTVADFVGNLAHVLFMNNFTKQAKGLEKARKEALAEKRRKIYAK